MTGFARVSFLDGLFGEHRNKSRGSNNSVRDFNPSPRGAYFCITLELFMCVLLYLYYVYIGVLVELHSLTIM